MSSCGKTDVAPKSADNLNAKTITTGATTMVSSDRIRVETTGGVSTAPGVCEARSECCGVSTTSSATSTDDFKRSLSASSPMSFFQTLPQSLKSVMKEQGTSIKPATQEVVLQPVSTVEDIESHARLFSNVSSPSVIKRVCQSCVPGWAMFDPDRDIKVSQIMAGLTNQLFKVELRRVPKGEVAMSDQDVLNRDKIIESMNSQTVLFRIYGKDVSDLYDTNFEVAVFKVLSGHGIAPKLIGEFAGGRVEEWILGPALLVKDMCKPPVLCGIAAILGRFHKLHIACPELKELSASQEPSVWRMLARWRKKAMEIYDEAKSAVKKLEDANSPDAKSKLNFVNRLTECNLEEMSKEADNLKDLLLNEAYCEKSSIVETAFCHNDVQENNILITDVAIRLIDFEYADFNYPAYDIANFLWESTCDYCYDSYPFYKIEMSVDAFPSEEIIRLFGAVYLSELDGTMILPSSSVVDGFVASVRRFALASHLVWGFWSIIRSPQAPTTNEFDFLRYAKDRFQCYTTWKKHLNELSLFSPKQQ